eukprot:5396214-Amphidinium_carterae.5
MEGHWADLHVSGLRMGGIGPPKPQKHDFCSSDLSWGFPGGFPEQLDALGRVYLVLPVLILPVLISPIVLVLIRVYLRKQLF